MTQNEKIESALDNAARRAGTDKRVSPFLVYLLVKAVCFTLLLSARIIAGKEE